MVVVLEQVAGASGETRVKLKAPAAALLAVRPQVLVAYPEGLLSLGP